MTGPGIAPIVRHVKVFLLAAVAALVLAAPASAAAPTRAAVWAKVRTAWVMQARAAHQPIRCMYSHGFPASSGWGDAKCEAGTSWKTVTAYFEPEHYNSRCQFRAAVYGGHRYGGTDRPAAHLNVCQRGWLKLLPQLFR